MMKNNILLIILAVLFLSILTACSPEKQLQRQLDKVMAEEVTYTGYVNNGFSIEYPYWPETEDQDERVDVSVSMGYCTVIINTEKAPADPLYDILLESIEGSGGTLLIADRDTRRVKYSALYQNLTMMSDSRIYSCNGKAHIVSVICIEQADKDSQHIHERVFGSADCKEEQVQEDVVQIPEVDDENISYVSFEEDDFIIEYPDWDSFPEESEQRVLGVTKGVCSILVDKHNARPGDVINWLETAIEKDDVSDLLGSYDKKDIYYINYELPYEQYTATAKSKLIYCNYMTYMTQVLCLNELMTDNFEEMRDRVLESAVCTEEYEIPTPEIVEKKKEEIIEEEPEVIEELEDNIVKTDAGAEFGIDEEMVVYFINNNAFFGKIMRDFPKGNLVIEDKENDRELELRAKIDHDGKITLLEDGSYSDADVTLIIPLRDALNIFSNAQNINPLTLLGFAMNVRTEPASIKNDVIQKVLRGEYN